MSEPMPPRDRPEKFLVAFSFAGEQRDLVGSIAKAVEERLGPFTVFFDEWYEAYIAGSDADILLQDIYGKRCALAIVCVSERYGGKPWTRAEYDAIRARVSKARRSTNDRDRQGVLPIRVGDGDVPGIFLETGIVPDVRPAEKSLEQVVELIVERLHLASAHPPWPNEPKPFDHGLADRTQQWPAIQTLMTAGTAKPILIFKGPSGYSKSVLLDAAIRYANILSVPAAYVDFKDTQFIHQTNVLQRLQLDLDALLPDFATAEKPEFLTLLKDLRKLTSPALVLFDTYEKIAENKELVELIEIQLLAEVTKCKQLRFLIAGQKVPERAYPRWDHLAEKIVLNKINDQQAWTVWIRQKNPDVHDKLVEGAVAAYEGEPANISSFLNSAAEKLPRTG
jgi:TIR domain